MKENAILVTLILTYVAVAAMVFARTGSFDVRVLGGFLLGIVALHQYFRQRKNRSDT